MDFNHLIGKRINILAPLLRSHKGDFKQILAKLEDQGFLKVRINGKVMDLQGILSMEASPYISYDLDIMIDRLHLQADSESMNRFIRSLDDAVKFGNGSHEVILHVNDTNEEFKYTLKK